jgi:hypothetical protein
MAEAVEPGRNRRTAGQGVSVWLAGRAAGARRPGIPPPGLAEFGQEQGRG